MELEKRKKKKKRQMQYALLIHVSRSGSESSPGKFSAENSEIANE